MYADRQFCEWLCLAALDRFCAVANANLPAHIIPLLKIGPELNLTLIVTLNQTQNPKPNPHLHRRPPFLTLIGIVEKTLFQ